jgi:AraC-like DNA-binding protein
MAWSRVAEFADPHAFEASLLEALIGCPSGGASVAPRGGRRRRAAIMKRFLEFLQVHPNEPLQLSQICAAIGMSERGLRTCCEEYLGMGPIRYLWLRRMHLARQALLSADPDAATVTGIATEYGFWELGRFSVRYRDQFGELPSATLRRARRETRRPNRDPFAFRRVEPRSRIHTP